VSVFSGQDHEVVAPGESTPSIGLGQVSTFASGMDISDNTFGPTSGEEWVLKILANMDGQFMMVEANSFNGEDDSAFPVRVDKAVVHFKGNQFNDLNHGAIYGFLSTTHMKSGAANYFYGAPTGDIIASIIFSEAGEVDLFCGFNRLIRPVGWEPTFQFVEYRNQRPNLFDDWRWNYWGYDASTAYLLSDVYDYVPSGIDLGTPLPSFNTPYFPCDDRSNEPKELLEAGLNAESYGDYSLAQEAYAAILLNHADSKEGNEALVRLKTIGLFSEYGSIAYSEIIVILEDAILAAETANEHLAVFERCVELLLLGRYEDHWGSDTALQEMRAATSDLTDQKCIDTALLELATYPIPGQNSQSHLSRIEQVIASQNAISDLMNYSGPAGHSGTDESQNLPESFLISNCYPNPFNPVTTMLLDVPKSGVTSIALFNLLGQEVMIVHDEVLEAGQHRFVIDGSALATGMYVVRAAGTEGQTMRKIMLLK
jgi:hypothetical protein